MIEAILIAGMAGLGGMVLGGSYFKSKIAQYLTGGTAAGAVYLVDGYTMTSDYLAAGIAGTSYPALIFTIGVGALALTMAWNYIATSGKTLVR